MTLFLALILHDNANNVQFVVIIGIYALQCSFSSLASLGPKMSIAGRQYQYPTKLNIIPLLTKYFTLCNGTSFSI